MGLHMAYAKLETQEEYYTTLEEGNGADAGFATGIYTTLEEGNGADAGFVTGIAVDAPRSPSSSRPETAPDVHIAPQSDSSGRVALFREVCTALGDSEDPTTHDLLQVLKRDLEQVQGELQSTAMLATGEQELMAALSEIDIIGECWVSYQRAVEAFISRPPVEQQATVTQPTTLECELSDLLGLAPAPTTTTAQPATVPVQLVKTKSEQAFEDFFAQSSTSFPVFSPQAKSISPS